jgi:hypothetical protein
MVFAHSIRDHRRRPVGQFVLLPIFGWLLVSYIIKDSGAHVWFPKQAAATTLE